jgi:hypothetical protein
MRYLIAMGFTLAVAGPLIAQEQHVVARPLPTFSAQTGSRSRPKAAVWGMVIGGVTGAAVGAYLVLGHPCRDGWECRLRPGTAMLGIGFGGAVGMLVGGAVGHAIDRNREFNVGIRLSLPSPH